MVVSRAIPVLQGESPEPEGAHAPVNNAERRLRHLLLAAGFPEASWQEQVQLGVGAGSTTPDVIFKPEGDADESLKNIAIYLDGMSRALHGNAQTSARDQIIRARLREICYAENGRSFEVITITAHELGDPTAMTRHFKTLARYLEMDDIRNSVSYNQEWFSQDQ